MVKSFGLYQKRLSKSDISSNIPSPVNNSGSPSSFNSSFTESSFDSSNNVASYSSVKSLLKHYKRLEVALAKFNSKSGVTKVNVLRTTLLPFLRSSYYNEENYLGDPKVYDSLTKVGSTIFFKWWEALLTSIYSQQQQFSNMASSETFAFLEGISRILSRLSFSKLDPNGKSTYKKLLTITLEYSIRKLHNLKVLTLANSAFIGKVFAYSFFYVDDVSTVLLFMLNVNQKLLQSVNQYLPEEMNEVNCSAIDELKCKFPSHLHKLVNYKGNKHILGRQKSFANCIIPPSHPVPGIKEASGLWIQRWSDSESDVFNSFLRHYCSLLSQHLHGIAVLPSKLIIHSPGLNILLCHINRILNVAIASICKNDCNKLNLSSSNSSISQNVVKKPVVLKNLSRATTTNLKTQEANIKSLTKIFRTIRALQYSSCRVKLGYFVESMLKYISKTTSVHDHNRIGLLYSVIYEFINYTDAAVEWEFWLSTIYMCMGHTDHLQVLISSLAFLFNIWDMLPELTAKISADNHTFGWVSDNKESYKVNFSDWLISDTNWLRFLTHWHPMVRSYYMRFVIWRLIGVNSFEHPSSVRAAKHIQSILNISLEELKTFHLFHSIPDIWLKADNPLANKKIGILTLNSSDLKLLDAGCPSFGKEFRKSHPYEVFDEAIYSCTSLHNSSAVDEKNEKVEKGHILTSSIEKLFKKLSDSDTKSSAAAKENMRNSSGSSSPISRSSSPSTTSFKSLSYNSSLLTDSECSSYATENSEFQDQGLQSLKSYYQISSEIVRPSFKFEVIIDHYAMQKVVCISEGRMPVCTNASYIPTRIKVPSISIHLETGSVNKFFENDSLRKLLHTHEGENENFKQILSTFPRQSWINLGRALNEWNLIVSEFENYLLGQNKPSSFSNLLGHPFIGSNKISESDYLKKIIPFMTTNSLNDTSIFIDIASP